MSSGDQPPPTPGILFIGGHDPTGGAGIQADIETAAAHHCRAYSLISCLTAQDSRNAQHIYPQEPAHFVRQAEALLADITPDWIKIGLIGDAGLASQIAALIRDLNKPVVLDPVLAAGGGFELAGQQLIEIMYAELLPSVYLLTPNRAEARRLSKAQTMQAAATNLLSRGCQHIMLTAADETDQQQVTNTLYSQPDEKQYFHWPKLPYVYHGSGCTLASACACQLAHGKPVRQAVQAAQQFTWHSLQAAERVGKGQHLPSR